MTEMQGRQKKAGENYDRVPQNKDLHGEKETRLLTLSEHEQNVPYKIIKWQVKKKQATGSSSLNIARMKQ